MEIKDLFAVMGVIIGICFLIVVTIFTLTNIGESSLTTGDGSNSSSFVYTTPTTLTAEEGITSSEIKGYNDTWLDFDGSNDYVLVPSNVKFNGSTGYTISAWVYPKIIGLGSIYDEQYSAGGSCVGFGFKTGGDLTLASANSTFSKYIESNTGGILPINTWSYVTGVFNGTHLIVYVNGVSNTPKQIQSSSIALNCSNFEKWMGKGDAPFDFLNGSIDDFRIYNISLNSTQILTIYTNGRENQTIVTSSNLIARYKFNEKNGIIAYDSSGNTNHGTISGATWRNDGVLITLTNGVDYTLDTMTGVLTLSAERVYSWIVGSWGYTSKTDTNNAAGTVATLFIDFIPWLGLILLIIGVSVVLFFIIKSFRVEV